MGVRGSASQRTPPRSQATSTAFRITDKLWQTGSGERSFTHSRDINNFTGALPPLVSWGSYQCEEVTDGNAKLIWGACMLLFFFSLHWQRICCGEWGWHILQQLAGVPVASRLLMCCVVWSPGSRIKLQASETGHAALRQDQAKACKHGKCVHESTALFHSGQETQICRCWTAGRHQSLFMGNKCSRNIVYNSL